MTIRLLPQEVSSKIAAGEVIEHPASVVKELLENSLDAASSEVIIEISNGGLDEIRITDNGFGIEPSQTELAFERFATSKLTTVPDLESISTLGFRGEALPSVAAISHMTLVSKSKDSHEGRQIEVYEGKIVSSGPSASRSGTTITVRELFANFPARRKFLRSVASESSRIQTVVSRYALAYPSVKFELTLNGKSSVKTTGSGNLREVVSDIYGANIAHSMIEIDVSSPQTDPVRPAVHGMVSPGSISRSNRSHMMTFVNKRWVQNRMLTYCIQNAYRGFLMERRFPIAIINVKISPEDIDVNVHPSKVEVRFRREGESFSTIQQAVRNALVASSPVPQVGTAPTSTQSHFNTTSALSPDSIQNKDPIEQSSESITNAPKFDHSLGENTNNQQPMLPKTTLPALRVLGQINNTYIISEGPDGLYLIDQHAAHERVLFERVNGEYFAKDMEPQSLIEPETIELDTRQQEILNAHQHLVNKLGFITESFGDGTYIIRAVSALLPSTDHGQALIDVLDTMAEGGGFESWEERAAYSIACHGAIRAGDTLTVQEMSELIRQLEICQHPHSCPHGRPTMIHMPLTRLEREFGRTV